MTPRKWFLLNFGFLSVVTIACIALGAWFWYGSLEESVTGLGQMVPQGKLGKIMAPSNGIVAKVLVREDQAVKKGQVLIELDPEVGSIEQDMLVEELHLLQDEAKALRAAYQGGGASGMGQVQSAWLAATQEAEQTDMASARKQIEKVEHQYNEAIQREQNLREVLASRESLLEQYRALERQGGLSKKEMLTYEHEVLEQRGQLASAAEEVQARAAELEQARHQPNSLKARYQKDILDRLTTHQRQVVSLAGEAAKSKAIQKRELIKAPMDGIINEQVVHGPGEVVNAGAVLLSLVPQNTPLVAELKVTNQDLAFIHLNQSVKLRVDALPYQRFGRLTGTIQSISPSSVMDEKGNPYFIVRVKPDKAVLSDESGKKVPLKSGMTVSGDIITREKNILSFFTDPIMQHFDKAFRDPSTN